MIKLRFIKKAILLLSLVCVFSGCFTNFKAVKDLSKIDSKYHNLLSEYCSANYPSTDSVHVITKLLPGKLDTITDTLTVYGLDNVVYKYINKTVKQVDTLTVYTTISKSNKANEELLTNKLATQIAVNISNNNKIKSKNRTIVMLSLFLVGICIGLITKNYKSIVGIFKRK